MSATINEKKPRLKNKVGGKIRSANRGMVGYEGKRAKQRRKKYVKQLEKCNESCWGFFLGGAGVVYLGERTSPLLVFSCSSARLADGFNMV